MSKSLIIFATAFLLSSCAFPLPSAGPGFILTDTTEGIAMNNNVAMSKESKACQTNILGIVAFGDASIQKAKQKGNIQQIASIDRTFFGVLGVFSKACTVVTGN